jgi:hypothetical protein
MPPAPIDARGYGSRLKAGTTMCPDAGWMNLQSSGEWRREVEKSCQQASQSILAGEQVLTSTSPVAISNPPGITSGFLALDGMTR